MCLRTRLHVVPDPESSGWLVLEMTDQEAFDWDREHYGEPIAITNLQCLQDEPDRLRIPMGGEA